MIETVKKLCGAPILYQHSEEVLGRACDFIFDADTDVVLAVVLTTNSIIPLTRAVLLRDILKVSKRGIILADTARIRSVAPEDFPGGAVTYFGSFHNQPVQEGQRSRGRIRDAVFDFEAGELTDFIVSDSRLQMLLGRKHQVEPRNLIREKERIVVKKEKYFDK